MGKLYESVSLFNYSWDQVARAFWRRYPNPQSGHVLSEDTVHREILRNGLLYSKRLLIKTNRLPKWGEKWVKSRETAVVEESLVDPKDMTIITLTRNIGFQKVMTVVEKVVYTPDPTCPTKTVAKRTAWIESGMYGFRRAIEGFGVKRFEKNANKAADGFRWVLARLFGGESGGIQQTSITGQVGQTIRELAKKKGPIGQATSVYAANTTSGGHESQTQGR